MSKLVESVIGLFVVFFPFVATLVLGFVWGWDFTRIYTGLPHDPFALIATVTIPVYGLMVAKLVYTWAAVRLKT